VGRSENLFEASLFLDNEKFDRIEQRIAAIGMPSRVLLRLVMPMETVPSDDPRDDNDQSEDALQEAKVWHTETLNELRVSRWRLLWPLSPPEFIDGKPDRRPATREQLREALAEMRRTRSWVIAIFCLLLVLTIARSLFR
jgi:hypothetical protein